VNEELAMVAAVIGEPTRAEMLSVLADGRAYPAGQLARAAGAKPQTASFHLEKLLDAGLVVRVKQGRHIYYALTGEPVAEALETLALIARPKQPLTDTAWRGPEAMRFARTCYGHLAGKLGIAVLDGMLDRGYLEEDRSAFAITPDGSAWFDGLGVSTPKLKRPLTRKCLDWSERRPHLAGALGVALTTRLIDLQWLARKRDSRAIRLTPLGRESLERNLNLRLKI
jgi:DNA-binding transcriptional ArsR family regulator